MSKPLSDARRGEFVRFEGEEDYWEVMERLPRYIALISAHKDRGVSRGSKFWNAPVEVVSDTGLYDPDEDLGASAMSEQELQSHHKRLRLELRAQDPPYSPHRGGEPTLRLSRV